MSQHEILSKLSEFKGNIQQLFSQALRDLRAQKIKKVAKSKDAVDVYMDDLPLTLSRDPGPNIKFYPTENSKFAKGASKEVPRGLDRFDEREA